MTARRRRAGSESYVEEPIVPGAPTLQGTHQPSASSSLTLLAQSGASGQWSSPADQAYYKKTDRVSPGSSGGPAPGPQPPAATTTTHHWPSYPAQPYTYPSQETNTFYPSGASYRPETNQWYNSGAHWNKGVSDNRNIQTPGKNFGSLGHSGASASDWSPGVTYPASIDNSDMASRDRTQEFARIVRSQQGSYSNGTIPHHEGKRPRDLRQYKDFMQRSKLIGRNISSTYAKLEKLTHLAKKRSLFDDSHDREIQELTGIIRHDLSSLTKQLTDLRNRSRVSAPSGNSAHLQKHSSNLVGTLQTKVAFITQKFKDILEVRTENLKKQAERREQFTGGIVSGELPPGAMDGHHQGSVLLADEVAAASFASSMEQNSTNGEVAINLGNGSAYQQKLQLMEEQDTFLQSRADTMRTIESTIVELGQMFTQLATMVKEQEELVDRIDTNVEDAELNVEAAHSELLKYFKSVSSNRMLMIKVFGIMIVFFVIFVVFMA